MPYRFSRYLGKLDPTLNKKQTGPESKLDPSPNTKLIHLQKPIEFTWRDYLLMLLRIDVGIEHALMVQYLYAAYSLGGEQVPPDKRDMVRRWQQTILSIAKEEMGHLLTVQNVLTCMGAPVYLDRGDYPWDLAFYPFPFELEPLTLHSLAKYVYAEAPVGWKDGSGNDTEKVGDWDTIRKLALNAPMKDRSEEKNAVEGEQPPQVHSVALLFSEMLAVVREPGFIPDADFFAETFSQQANWDTWACNQGNVSGEDAPDELSGDKAPPRKPTLPTTADVLVIPVATRDDVIRALEQVASQGEGLHLHGEQSHFDRFYSIYKEFEREFSKDRGFRPARDLPVNPTTFEHLQRESGDTAIRYTYIANPVAHLWATLFNMRYRLLLTYLTHSFRLARGVNPNKGPGAYQMVMHRAFCEMYNLKALSEILIRQPLYAGVDRRGPFKPAGPTFELPYTLNLPESAASCWMQYLDILGGCEEVRASLCHKHRAQLTQQEKDFLAAMANADQECKAWLDTVLKATSVYDRVL